MEPSTIPPIAPAEPVPGGLPWEAGDTARTPAGALRTLVAVLTSPTQAFRAMRRTGGVGDPLLYLVLVGTVGMAFGLFWQLAASGWLASMGLSGELGNLMVDDSSGLVTLFLAPLIVLLSATLATAVYHFMLLLFGGAPQPIETTLRVVCYASGSSYALQIVPICGAPVGMIWGLVVTIVGLREAQGVPGGRAAAAVLLPAALVCLCCALLWMAFLGAAMSLPMAGR